MLVLFTVVFEKLINLVDVVSNVVEAILIFVKNVTESQSSMAETRVSRLYDKISVSETPLCMTNSKDVELFMRSRGR